MSKELDELSKELAKDKPTVIRREISLYRTTINTASATFLREVDQESRRMKQANLTLLAILQQAPNSKK